jgi:histidine triad (HIT) family protein
MSDDGCIFCGIASGDLPAFKIHEDERTVAFMDINPATRGHCLVIPKRHVDDIVAADPEDVSACAKVAQQLADRALERLGADGAAIFSLCRAAAGQTVFHLHFHVVPRYEGDGLSPPWIPTQGDMSEIEEAAEEMKA